MTLILTDFHGFKSVYISLICVISGLFCVLRNINYLIIKKITLSIRLQQILILLQLIILSNLNCGRNDPGDTPTIQSISPIAVYNLNIPEPSGLVFNTKDSTFYTVSDGVGGAIYQISIDGQIVNTYSVNGNDMEGITFSDNYDTLYVAEEGSRQIIKYSTTGIKISPINVSGTNSYNNGLEGIAVKGNSFFVVNEKSPAAFIELNLQGEKLYEVNISYALDLSDICYDPVEDIIWLVSHESQSLFKISLAGQLIKQWKIPVVQPEGVTIVNGRFVYIVCDKEAKLYVFNKPI